MRRPSVGRGSAAIGTREHVVPNSRNRSTVVRTSSHTCQGMRKFHPSCTSPTVHCCSSHLALLAVASHDTVTQISKCISEHICKSSRPCSNMHRAINKSAKPLADMCIICVCELLQCTNRIARDVQRSSKRYVIPINKRMQHSDLLHVAGSSSHVLVRVCVCGCIHTPKRFEAALM